MTSNEKILIACKEEQTNILHSDLLKFCLHKIFLTISLIMFIVFEYEYQEDEMMIKFAPIQIIKVRSISCLQKLFTQEHLSQILYQILYVSATNDSQFKTQHMDK